MTDLTLKLTNNNVVKRIAGKLVRKGPLSHEQVTQISEEIKSKSLIKAPVKEKKPVPRKPAPVLKHSALEKDFNSHLRRGTIVLLATAAIVTGFAGVMPISGAVIVGGTFVVQQASKKVQHKTGGIVKEINVKDGKKVKTGDVLILLDDTDPRAQVATIAQQIDETEIRIARLTAEQDDAPKVILPVKFVSPKEVYEKIITSELDYFRKRKLNLTNVQKIAEQKIAQLEKQIKGSEIQLKTNEKQNAINDSELIGAEELLKKKFTSIQRVTPLQREKTRIAGSSEQIEASIQETRNKIAEIKLQTEQTLGDFHATVMRELSDASSKLGQLKEQFVVVRTALTRTEVIAPASGIVQELSIHTVGGVISPAETIMTIVPENIPLEITTRLAPDKIDQVKVGQSARVRFTAFTRTTPDINGTVNLVSPDLIESKSGAYYEVRISVDQNPMGLTLSPGMPVEVFLKTEPRTLLSYLTKPITEQFPRMFIER